LGGGSLIGYSDKAVKKGTIGEYLVKVYFLNEEYNIFNPDNHETSLDFMVEKQNVLTKIQVKCVNTVKISGVEYLRVRNKHGRNAPYKKGDYDLLVGVDTQRLDLYIFKAEDIIDNNFGEALTVGRVDGKEITRRKRPQFTKISLKEKLLNG